MWRRVTSVRSLARYNHSDPVSRYREQLQRKAASLNLPDIDALKTHLKDELDHHRKEFSKIDPLAELEAHERKMAADAQANQSKAPREPRSPATPAAPFKTLNSYLDVERIAQLDRTQVEYLWRARFTGKDRTLCAVIEAPTYARLALNARKYPLFVLPLPRDGQDGMEMHYVQWAFVGPQTTHCIITSLEEYKLHGEYARPHTLLAFHQELSGLHGLVLMNGTVETDLAVGVAEAQLLVLNVQRFYGAAKDAGSAVRLQLLQQFASGDDAFDMEALVKEATLFGQ